MSTLIRRGDEGDVASLATLMARAVRATAPQVYTPGQVNAWWATCTDDLIRDRLTGASLWVVDDDGPVAFMILRGSLVDLLYTDPDHARQGHATALLRHAQVSKRHLHAEASLVSRPLFEQVGFRPDGPVPRELAGIAFENTRMVWP